jgi:MYXO-CTERM domain-containing protein
MYTDPKPRLTLLLGLALLASPTMMNAQSAQDTATQAQNATRNPDRGFDWGRLGLLGLAGLTGLRRREPMGSEQLATERR